MIENGIALRLGEVALVTGALSGIGRATAQAFAQAGLAVVIGGRNRNAGEALREELEANGGRARFFQTDVRDERAVSGLVEHAIQQFGRLDHAANCAGTEGASIPLVDQTLESYTETFNANVLGTFFAMKHEMRAMFANGGGSIVNVSSTMSRVGRPGLSIYSASKSAVEGLTRAGSIEGAPMNVRVNAIAPGPIDTPMLERVAAPRGGVSALSGSIPMRRVGTPREAADLILFLCSANAGYVTGQSVALDGGRLAC